MRCVVIDSELREREREREREGERERERKRGWDGKFMAEMHHGTNIKLGVHTYIVNEGG